MKKIILAVSALLILSACTTTRVYPGEQEGRSYVNQSARACKTLEFTCPEGKQVFSDESGCGCEMKVVEEPVANEPDVTPPAEEPAVEPEESAEEPETLIEEETETPPDEEPVADEPEVAPPAEEPPTEESAPPAENPASETPATETEQTAQ